MTKKLLFIALDGATLDLLDDWMQAGELPLLAKLFREGVGGTLTSTIPWATPTAFASFMTGTNPGKHGVYDFGRLIGDDYTAFVPTNGGDVNGRSLFHILSQKGYKVGSVNMPMTYPAEPVDGFMISGIPYPNGSPKLCHPPDLLDTLRTQGWDLARNASDDLGGSYADYLAGLHDLVRVRGEASAWLWQTYQPDMMAIHFLETDQVQHRFWQFMEDEPKYEANGRFTHAILDLYKTVEIALQKILTAVGEQVTLCLMSDHGFGPTRHQVWVNNWLVQQGFLTLKPSANIKQTLYRVGLSPAAIREAAPERLKLAILQFFERQKGRALANELEEGQQVSKKGILDTLTEQLAIDFYDVDWSQTVAFSTGTTSVGYVWLNCVARDPQGIVTDAQYNTLRESIRQTLQAWEPVGAVLTSEELWHGSRLAHAPDLIIKWADPSTDARYFQTRFSSHHLIKAVPNDYAGHRLNGLFLFHGADVLTSDAHEQAHIVDLAPTALWLMGEDVPSNMDGRSLTHLFTHNHPVNIEEVADEDLLQRETLTKEEEEAIRESLRGLGYME